MTVSRHRVTPPATALRTRHAPSGLPSALHPGAPAIPGCGTAGCSTPHPRACAARPSRRTPDTGRPRTASRRTGRPGSARPPPRTPAHTAAPGASADSGTSSRKTAGSARRPLVRNESSGPPGTSNLAPLDDHQYLIRNGLLAPAASPRWGSVAVARRSSRSFALASLGALHLDQRLRRQPGAQLRGGTGPPARPSLIRQVEPPHLFIDFAIKPMGPPVPFRWGHRTRS